MTRQGGDVCNPTREVLTKIVSDGLYESDVALDLLKRHSGIVWDLGRFRGIAPRRGREESVDVRARNGAPRDLASRSSSRSRSTICNDAQNHEHVPL